MRFFSNFLYNIENSDDTITTSAGKHVSLVAEIDTEASSAEVFDLGTWLKHIVSIEDLDLVRATTSSNNQITSGLLELRSIDKAWLLWWKSLVPWQVLVNRLAGTEVPKLELLAVLVGTCQQELVVEIDWVSADVRTIDWTDWVGNSDVPNLNVIIPSTTDNHIWVLLVKLDAKDPITMSWLSSTSSLEVGN